MRGFALLTIPVNHLWISAFMAGIVAWHVPTTTLFGFSSAAELLVFTAGYAFVLANRRRLEAGGVWAVQHHAARRGLWLLAANALMLVAVCTVLAVFRFQPAAGHRGFWQSLLAPPEAWLATLGHLAKPMPTLFTFDVLPLYALLLLAAPLAKAHLRRHPAWVVGVSVALYGLACTGPLGHKVLGVDGESFNPLAWQVLFVTGMLAATRGWFREPPSYRLLPYVLAIVGLGFVWALSYRYPLDLPWLPHMPHLPMTAHADIGLLPILHILGMITLTSWIYYAAPARLQRGVGETLGAVGRHSLPIYIGGNILQFAAVPVLAWTGGSRGSSLVVSGVLTLILILYARSRSGIARLSRPAGIRLLAG